MPELNPPDIGVPAPRGLRRYTVAGRRHRRLASQIQDAAQAPERVTELDRRNQELEAARLREWAESARLSQEYQRERKEREAAAFELNSRLTREGVLRTADADDYAAWIEATYRPGSDAFHSIPRRRGPSTAASTLSLSGM